MDYKQFSTIASTASTAGNAKFGEQFQVLGNLVTNAGEILNSVNVKFLQCVNNLDHKCVRETISNTDIETLRDAKFLTQSRLSVSNSGQLKQYTDMSINAISLASKVYPDSLRGIRHIRTTSEIIVDKKKLESMVSILSDELLTRNVASGLID
jgi:hypothetical protein